MAAYPNKCGPSFEPEEQDFRVKKVRWLRVAEICFGTYLPRVQVDVSALLHHSSQCVDSGRQTQISAQETVLVPQRFYQRRAEHLIFYCPECDARLQHLRMRQRRLQLSLYAWRVPS